MTTTIITAGSAAEFLSLLPRMLGFRPRRSLVLVPFARTRTLGAMRLDLPDEGADIEAYAATCIGMVCRVASADSVALVVFDDASFDADGTPPRDELARALVSKADACGLGIVDALCVADDGWDSFVRPEPAPRSLDELEIDPSGAERLAEPDGDQWSGSELPEVDETDAATVASALAALAEAVAVLCTDAALDESTRVDPRALDAAVALDDLPALFEGMLAWDASELDPFDAATAAWCLSRPALRDIALVGWTAGPQRGDEALAAQLRWEKGEPYPAELAQIMWGEGAQPEPRRLLDALAVIRAVAALAPESHRAGPLAVCAWLSWAAGRSTHAESYAKRAVETEPEHGLAEIVLSFVTAGHLPDWAFHRGSAR